jgi:hypothetical protein
MATTSFFKNLEKNALTKAKTKESPHKVIEVVDDGVFELVRQLVKKQNEAKNLKAEIDSLDDDVRTTAFNKFTALYESERENPGTVTVDFKNQKGEEASLQFIPTDNYCKIDEGKAQRLIVEFGRSVVKEEDLIVVDNKMFKKYEKVLDEFIRNTDKIPEEDKMKLFEWEKVYCVAPGTHNRLSELATKVKATVKEIFVKIGVIYQIKNVKMVNEISTPIAPATITPSSRPKKRIAAAQ